MCRAAPKKCRESVQPRSSRSSDLLDASSMGWGQDARNTRSMRLSWARQRRVILDPGPGRAAKRRRNPSTPSVQGLRERAGERESGRRLMRTHGMVGTRGGGKGHFPTMPSVTSTRAAFQASWLFFPWPGRAAHTPPYHLFADTIPDARRASPLTPATSWSGPSRSQ